MQEKNKNISDISIRLSKLIDYLTLNPNSFAEKLGYGRSQAIYDMLSGKSSPSWDFFSKLLNSEYSEIISLDWLMRGTGPISRIKDDFVVNEPIEKYNMCNNCPYKLLAEKYEGMINDYKNMIEIMQKQLTAQSQDQPDYGKRRSA